MRERNRGGKVRNRNRGERVRERNRGGKRKRQREIETEGGK